MGNSAGKAVPTFDTSSWATLEPAFNKHIESYQTAAMSASQANRCCCWCFMMFYFFLRKKHWNRVKLKILKGCKKASISLVAPLAPRRRPVGCVRSRGRAVRPAVGPTGPGLERPAAGARGGGTPRCPAAAPGGPIRPEPRLLHAVPPLRSLPGAARRAAAGPGGPRDRAERGGGGARPGEARVVHAGALRMAAAVPRRMVGRCQLRGGKWEGPCVPRASGVCIRFRPQGLHLLQFWQMDQLLHGAIQISVVTIQQFKTSSGACNRFRPRILHLRRSWQMDQLSPGDFRLMVEQIQATRFAFAAILADGSVLTWGNPAGGGDSSAVQDQLRSVEQIQATRFAFAAILADGSVVTWGNSADGGDSSAVQDQLRSASDSGRRVCICCNFGRWISSFMGQPSWWWQQLRR